MHAAVQSAGVVYWKASLNSINHVALYEWSFLASLFKRELSLLNVSVIRRGNVRYVNVS